MGKGRTEPNVVTYSFPNFNFGDVGSYTEYITSPASAKGGRLVDVIASVNETFTATSTSAYFRVGTVADPDAYAEVTFGTAAADTPLSSASSKVKLYPQEIPPNSVIACTFVPCTGGTPEGKAMIHVVIAWNEVSP